MRAIRFSRLLAASALTVILTACGGGGGGGSLLGSGGGSLGPSYGSGGGSGGNNGGAQIVINNSLTQNNPNSFLTSEYTLSLAGGSTGLAQINAAQAYGLGASGNGITVGIIDTGIDADNVEFTGAISADSINIINNSNADLQGINPHGTWVAGVIGARKNNLATHGVAFNAELLVVKADTVSPSCPSGCFDSNNLANAVNYATSHNARIINMSLGAQGALGSTLTTAIQNAAANNVLVVTAAGNAGQAQVDAPANLGGTTGIAGSLLAVGAVDSNNQILSWSNKAGNARNWYLVAPGDNILTTDEHGMALVSGTSFAAPMVSGAAALVMEYAPYLTAQQTAEILLRSATDLGAAGVDDIYGHGLLNVGAALQPVGNTSVPSANGGSANTSNTTIALGSAFGNALQSNSLLAQGIMTDDYGRAFGFNMADRITSADYNSGLANFISTTRDTTVNSAQFGESTALTTSFTADKTTMGQVRDLNQQDGLQGDVRLALSTQATENMNLNYTHGYGLGQTLGLQMATANATANVVQASAMNNAYLGMLEGGNALSNTINLAEGLSLTLGAGMAEANSKLNDGETHNRTAYAAAVNYALGDFTLGLSAGQVQEANSTLDSASAGALAFGSGSTTNFVTISAALDLAAGLTLSASYQTGLTSIDATENSVIGDFRGLQSDSFAVALTADDVAQKNDSLTLAVSQPVRVNSGSAALNVATGVDAAGNVLYTSERASLTPSGRQIDIQAGYSLALNENETLGLSTVGTLNPGHDSSRGPAFSVGLRYQGKF